MGGTHPAGMLFCYIGENSVALNERYAHLMSYSRNETHGCVACVPGTSVEFFLN